MLTDGFPAVGPPRPGLLSALRDRLRPPRRLRLRPGGFVLIVGVFSLGLATLNTGNNLLYLLVGALLGLIALSGWVSEQTLSGNRVSRRVPFGVTAGQPLRIEYVVENRKRRMPSGGLELRDTVLARGPARLQPEVAERAFLPLIPAGQSVLAAEVMSLPRRGVYRFQRLVLATAYPFGLFTKERDLHLPGTLVVWPRTDRAVRRAVAGGSDGGRRLRGAGPAPGAERGDYRALRGYRAGDDPRDIHWRTTAKRAEPIIREYDRDPAESYWIVLDLAAPSEALGEAAVEVAASLAAEAVRLGDRFGFAAGSGRLPPPLGGGSHLEAILDLLAQVSLAESSALSLPAAAADCVLVTARAEVGEGCGDVVRVSETGAAA